MEVVTRVDVRLSRSRTCVRKGDFTRRVSVGRVALPTPGAITSGLQRWRIIKKNKFLLVLVTFRMH